MILKTFPLLKLYIILEKNCDLKKINLILK